MIEMCALLNNYYSANYDNLVKFKCKFKFIHIQIQKHNITLL